MNNQELNRLFEDASTLLNLSDGAKASFKTTIELAYRIGRTEAFKEAIEIQKNVL